MSDSETHKGDKREELGFSLHGERKKCFLHVTLLVCEAF